MNNIPSVWLCVALYATILWHALLLHYIICCCYMLLHHIYQIWLYVYQSTFPSISCHVYKSCLRCLSLNSMIINYDCLHPPFSGSLKQRTFKPRRLDHFKQNEAGCESESHKGGNPNDAHRHSQGRNQEEGGSPNEKWIPQMNSETKSQNLTKVKLGCISGGVQIRGEKVQI